MTNRNGTIIQWNGDGKPSSIGNIGFTYDGVGNRFKKVSGGETTLYPFPDFEIADDGTTTKSLAGGKQVCHDRAVSSSCTTGIIWGRFNRSRSNGEVLHKGTSRSGIRTRPSERIQISGDGLGSGRKRRSSSISMPGTMTRRLGGLSRRIRFAALGQGLNRYSGT